MKKLPRLNIKKSGSIIDIDGKRRNFKIGRYVTLKQSNYPRKTFVLQEILFEDGEKEIRIGYYIIGKKPRMKNKWTWGQFCPFFPRKDLVDLIKKAKAKRII
ncbi:MAG: hypothetical protein MUP45_04905 [Candidatus Marinimicrobia bacterium]|nr:hypothetical protein [Candidatus Neomarinimicrobiota bacterium]